MDNFEDRDSLIKKVYATVFVMLLSTIALAYMFMNQTRRPSQIEAQPSNDAQQEPPAEPARASNRVTISDTSLRKISISAKDLLLINKDGSLTFEPEMLEFIRAIKNKYRVYLLTQISKTGEEYNKAEKEEIHELLMKLVKQDIIKGKQRLMYSSSEVGHIAQIRHLAADLHIESDFQIIKKLVIFMNKFHLIQQKSDLTPKQEIQDFVKANPNKILYFQDIVSYTQKIKNALSK